MKSIIEKIMNEMVYEFDFTKEISGCHENVKITARGVNKFEELFTVYIDGKEAGSVTIDSTEDITVVNADVVNDWDNTAHEAIEALSEWFV